MNLEEEEEDLQPVIPVNKVNDHIAGVDEVGRGSLFGPVFAAAVILNQPAESLLLAAGLKDSKKLSFKKRSLLTPLIKENSSDWGLGQASNREIDKLGIRHATELAMLRALQRISIEIDLVLVDGILPIKIWKGQQETLIAGDNICTSISAASVIAKEYRDCLIRRIGKNYPGYLLEKNFGYGTKDHRNALVKLGPTRLHRMTFLSKILIA